MQEKINNLLIYSKQKMLSNKNNKFNKQKQKQLQLKNKVLVNLRAVIVNQLLHKTKSYKININSKS